MAGYVPTGVPPTKKSARNAPNATVGFCAITTSNRDVPLNGAAVTGTNPARFTESCARASAPASSTVVLVDGAVVVVVVVGVAVVVGNAVVATVVAVDAVEAARRLPCACDESAPGTTMTSATAAAAAIPAAPAIRRLDRGNRGI